MANCVVLGMQWGDEGKGKIVDLITPSFDVVARYQGGHNAGHTVFIKGTKIILHLIPSGILHKGKLCLIGNGVVFNPKAFLNEIAKLKELGVAVDDNVVISPNAHLIMPYHFEIERLSEERMGDKKIGTTLRGIGPAYVDKMARCGIRVGDLLNEAVLREKITQNVVEKNRYLDQFGWPPLDKEAIFDEHMNYARQIEKHIDDVSFILEEKFKAGCPVLFEGAQGALLDIDHGTYPYVTASNSTIGGVCTGLGVGADKIDAVIGVTKAYTTRVGGGPFPTEIHGKQGRFLMERGNEFGATTGRPRRCGWFDGIAAAYAVRLNGVKKIALTKSDVLDGMDEINICVGYKYKSSLLRHFPTDIWALEQVEPQYVTVKGWEKSVNAYSEFTALPQAFKDYIARIEDIVHADVAFISTGRERHETIFRDEELGGLVDLEAVKTQMAVGYS
ncbi:MAG: adenylosuccinate synthase [Candidatus Aminicenantes bacterium]|nr:adenylosuccinate synthase [Candidatus Aminicenantes bacterium]